MQHDGVTWQCVQAFTGANNENDVRNANGKVTVVCTPSGGEQTVRLELDSNWIEKISDDSLTKMISDSRG